MYIPQEIKQQAYEGLLHFLFKKWFCHELGVSKEADRVGRNNL